MASLALSPTPARARAPVARQPTTTRLEIRGARPRAAGSFGPTPNYRDNSRPPSRPPAAPALRKRRWHGAKESIDATGSAGSEDPDPLESGSWGSDVELFSVEEDPFAAEAEADPADRVAMATSVHAAEAEPVSGIPDEMLADPGDPAGHQRGLRLEDEKVVLEKTRPMPSGANPRRVLFVAVDDTPESMAALEWTRDNIYQSGDVIHVLHVVPFLYEPALPTSDFLGGTMPRDPPISEPLMGKQIRKQQKDVKRVVGLLEKLLDRTSTPHVPDHPPYRIMSVCEPVTMTVAETILNVAKKDGADMIVVASRGRPSTDEWIMGSVSKFVLRHSEGIPVCLVHT